MNNPHDFQRIPEILGSQESHFVYKSKSNATAVLVGGGIGMVAILVSRDPESNPRMQKRSNCQTITFSKVITFFSGPISELSLSLSLAHFNIKHKASLNI